VTKGSKQVLSDLAFLLLEGHAGSNQSFFFVSVKMAKEHSCNPQAYRI